MNEIKVSYNQIEEANKEIASLQLGSKNYSPVNERIKAYRKVYPNGTIETQILEIKEDAVKMKAIVSDENQKIIATGTASEKLTGNEKKDTINKVSMLENCETSAVGRALGFAGFGVDVAIASAEDMEKVDKDKEFVIAKGISISMKDALDQAKLTINELYKKMGMRVQDLNDYLNEKIWTTLQDMNIWQLLRLESELKKANMEKSEWHCLYNQNTKAKEVVAENQEVLYKSTWRRFGEIALKICGTDEIKRQEVIDEYMEQEIDLGTSYEY